MWGCMLEPPTPSFPIFGESLVRILEVDAHAHSPNAHPSSQGVSRWRISRLAGTAGWLYLAFLCIVANTLEVVARCRTSPLAGDVGILWLAFLRPIAKRARGRPRRN